MAAGGIRVRVLLSTIGSRGDVQPLAALAVVLQLLDHEVRLCVPPDFVDWIASLGVTAIPIGPELRSTGKAQPGAAPPTPEQMRQMIEGTVAAQFETISRAAQTCDIIVGATALQVAAPSVAERMGIPYVFAAYCPAVLPSSRHAPPVLVMRGDKPAAADADFDMLWAQDAQRWNATWGSALNSRRSALGLPEVSDVRSHILTSRPWLAADAALAPWPDPADRAVLQTGAWILPDEQPLDAGLEAFLAAGEPPIYFGFGSIRAPAEMSRMMIAAARAVGRRAIVSRGWAELSLVDDGRDCFSVGDVNHQALFKRVAAVVHHGGAGTTTAAARAGAPQVIIAQHYDQHYWAARIRDLGIGVAHGHSAPTAESLASALRDALQPAVAGRARSVAAEVRNDGAEVAARALVRIT
jgi:vancomycin aglycone glucosyltransferase